MCQGNLLAWYKLLHNALLHFRRHVICISHFSSCLKLWLILPSAYSIPIPESLIYIQNLLLFRFRMQLLLLSSTVIILSGVLTVNKKQHFPYTYMWFFLCLCVVFICFSKFFLFYSWQSFSALSYWKQYRHSQLFKLSECTDFLTGDDFLCIFPICIPTLSQAGTEQAAPSATWLSQLHAKG